MRTDFTKLPQGGYCKLRGNVGLFQPVSQDQFKLTHSSFLNATEALALHGTTWICKILFDWYKYPF